MATIGGGLYAEAVHEFFEGIRSYDVPRAMAVVAADADLQSPWNAGTVTGKDNVAAVFETLLSNAEKRPSFSIRDIRGDGNLVALEVSISGRFGQAPQIRTFRLLHLKGVIHHIVVA
jgi:ketosteroid isomerase-like protein